ncbi:MAG: cysteine protease [Trizodia sp. TS-e1964]|nr:MAG: cysteine protease [Trizodia sp. TS-e1964]
MDQDRFISQPAASLQNFGGSFSSPRELNSSRKLSTREKIILLESSKLNDYIFPPWDSPPYHDEFELENGKDQFVDKPDLRLSSEQQHHFEQWKRPHELFLPSDSSSHGATMDSIAMVDLVQDLTTDCSLVASLCSVMAKGERRHNPIINSKTFFPFDSKDQKPLISRTGKYVFRLNFNGCYRRVTIDDRLPAASGNRNLYVVDRNNPGLLWPALLEKAYLKIQGGYDFPGSNSGTDLWILIGWIPEQVFLRTNDLSPDALWQRVFNAFQYNDVLITVGTGSLTRDTEIGLGLVGKHDYSVLDLKEFNGSRFLLVKNPWAKEALSKGYIPGSHSLDAVPHFDSTQKSEQPQTDDRVLTGTFWIEFSNIMQNFESIYLNWYPGLFSYRQDIHFSWDLSKFACNSGCLTNNPQFTLRIQSAGVVWLLLCKHLQTQTKIYKSVDKKDDQQDGGIGFISLYTFENGGNRAILSKDALERGPFVDSPQTLLRLKKVFPNTPITIVATQQSLAQLKYNFTLCAFSRSPITIESPSEKFLHNNSYSGTWTCSTSGGNLNSPFYSRNPQFSIEIPAVTDITLLIDTQNPELPVHVKLVWRPMSSISSTGRVSKISSRDLVGDSGDYRLGCALATINSVPSGLFTIVCSTFETGQLGDFTLRVSSMKICFVKPIPTEVAGYLSTLFPPATFPAGVNKILAPLDIERLTRFKVATRRLSPVRQMQAIQPSPDAQSNPPRLLIKISIELGQGPYSCNLATSSDNQYSNSEMDIVTPHVDSNSQDAAAGGGIWVVLERLGVVAAISKPETVQVEVFSDAPIKAGQWGISNS